jgi:hypothetical protein
MISLYVHSASTFIAEPGADTNRLKEELYKYGPGSFRRVNRFILLTMIGSRMCINGHALGANTAIYLTTDHGNLGDTVSVLDEIYTARSLPKPYNFINTMSNTAAFYLAQNLGVHGRNITLSSRHLSFERGLDLLETDFSAGVEENALIGGVDVAFNSGHVMESRDAHLWRSVDGSGWFYIRTKREGACGIFRENRTFQDEASCLKWIQERNRSSMDMVAFGASLSQEEIARWQETLGPVAQFNYLEQYGYCGSATVCGIGKFLEGFRGRSLLHINRDLHGNHSVLEIEAFQ